MPRPASLFAPDLPPGLMYRDDFIAASEEQSLIDAMKSVAFSDFEMHGVVAKRRVAFFGESYNRETAGPIPDFLLPLRARIADWARLDAAAFAMALINEYRPGAPIGWHRDAPQYEVIAGVSLLSECRMKFREYRYVPEGAKVTGPRRVATHELILAPRSAYVMAGKSRSDYEHHIPPVEALRYSLTFRTLR